MEITKGDTVLICQAPEMPRMQRLLVGQSGPVIDRYRSAGSVFYRVQLPGGPVDFVGDELELLSQGAAHASH